MRATAPISQLKVVEEEDGDAPKMSKSKNSTKEVIPMKKRIYRRMPVNEFQPQSIPHADLGGRLVFAVDIAKVDMVAAFAASDGHALSTICWKAPLENAGVLGILRGFRTAGLVVEVVMEPSGTYGDVLRYQLEQDAFPVSTLLVGVEDSSGFDEVKKQQERLERLRRGFSSELGLTIAVRLVEQRSPDAGPRVVDRRKS
jgi:hypothetical protein